MSKSVCDEILASFLFSILLTNSISLSLFHATVTRGKNSFGYPDLCLLPAFFALSKNGGCYHGTKDFRKMAWQLRQCDIC